MHALKIIYQRNILPLCTLVLGVLLFASCENDLKDIDRIINIKEEEAVDISKDVQIIYSDSAHVKAVLSGPEMRIYHDSTSNYEFQKGVEIIFYDQDLKETQRIKSEYGIYRTKQGLIEFRNNVVVTMARGDRVETEELFYDEVNKKYYNTVPIFFYAKNKGYRAADSFMSDLDFNYMEGPNLTGYMPLGNNSLFPSFGQ